MSRRIPLGLPHWPGTPGVQDHTKWMRRSHVEDDAQEAAAQMSSSGMPLSTVQDVAIPLVK